MRILWGWLFGIDEYLRANHPDYDRVYSEIIEMQKDLSDNILHGKTHRIKQVFNEMGLTSANEPYKSLCEFEKNYPKRLFMIYQLKDDDSTRGLRFENLEQIKKDKQLPVIENYELIYSARMKADTTLESIFTEFNTNRPYDFYGHSLSVSDIVVLSDKGKNSAYYCDKTGWEKVDKFFDYVHTRSAAISNYKGMTAFVGYDDKLYLGKSEKYLFSDNGFAYYDNSDKSLTYITDNLTLYPFLYGSGWVCSQHEMLDNGSFTKEVYAEFDRLQKGVLSQFEQIREIRFADKPFNYLETAEKQTEENYNKIDGIINNEPSEDCKKPSIKQQLNQAKKEQGEREDKKPPSHKPPGAMKDRIDLTPKQSRKVNALIKRLCCNYDNGNCIRLDDGDPCVCVQCITYSHIICKWFRIAVLPADKDLYIELAKPKNTRTCQNCRKPYEAANNKFKYCPVCRKIVIRKQKANYIRKRRSGM